MTDVTKLIDSDFLLQVAKKTGPVIAPISFLYLFLIGGQTYLLVLGLISLLFLAFYLNLNYSFDLVLQRKFGKERTKDIVVLGNKATAFLLKDKLLTFTGLMPPLLVILALIILAKNRVDNIAWVLLFLCIFSIFYYITRFISSAYLGRKYRKLF